MTAATPHRVIVAGAGPSGLTLACELALAGIPCRVLERRAWRTNESRAFVLHARTMEMFDLRGQADRIAAYGRPVSHLRVGVDGSIDFTRLDSRFAHLTVLPQSVTEDVLETRARELGVEIVRQAELVDLAQDADSVVVRVAGPTGEWEERAAFVVGCDGAHSVVRQLAEIPFEGDTLELSALLADVRLRRPPVDDMLLLSSGRSGGMVAAAYADGWYRVACLDGTRPWTAGPVDLDQLKEVMCEVTGHDLEPYAPRWISRFRLHERLARKYRSGRVLLAGDSAHLHSPLGGQGLNLGVQDAMNLGWKLAAVLTGRADPALLDTYEAERRPVAAKVINTTRWVTRVITSPHPVARLARRGALPRLLPLGPVQRLAREAMSGMSVRYPASRGAGPLGGERVPDVDLRLADGARTRLHDLMHDGRFLLVDLGPYGASAAAAGKWAGRVKAVVADLDLETDATVRQRLRGATAFLVRPDGHTAWSTRAKSSEARGAECRLALARWCGPGPQQVQGTGSGGTRQSALGVGGPDALG